ncbi:MAG TPA: bacteriohemerythrin [Azospirillaceae bacterium]|nr:bacteriohemerythrin [Azospirillaceae bacterium]
MTALDTAQPVALEWSDEYRTGHDAIDDDHKKLFALVNRLGAAVAAHDDPAVREVIKELLDYTVYHFGKEEVVMRRFRYTNFLAHKRMHDDFVREVATARDRLIGSAKTGLIPDTLVRFLCDWLSNHILKMDKDLGRHIIAHLHAA